MTVNTLRPQGALNLFGTANAVTTAGAADAADNGSTNADAEQRPRSKVWLNIGPLVGDGDQVALPTNIAIDTMRLRGYPWEYDMRGRKRIYNRPLSPAQREMKDQIDASNKLLELLQGIASELQAKHPEGISQVVTELVCVLQVSPADAVSDDEEPEANSRVSAIANLFNK